MTLVDDLHHLDQKPGYKIKDMGAESCDDTLKLTFEKCEEARLALDWKAAAVVKINEASLPTGCYRQQEKEYRFLHNKSSYLWYFNEAANGQSDWKSEPVCKGKVRRNCIIWLCAYCVVDYFVCVVDVVVTCQTSRKDMCV